MSNQHDDKLSRPNASSEPPPKFVSSRSGTRLFSQAALLERIEDAFADEHDVDQLLTLTQPQRYKRILETTDYVLAVESLQITSDEKADLVRRVYSHLFGFGALDELLADERITTIALNGAAKAAVRYGHDELVNITPPFADDQHLRVVIERLLLQAGAERRDDLDAIETGLTMNERPIAISAVLPSIAFGLNVDIRLHPRHAPTLDDLHAQGFMSDDALKLLRALLASPYGFVIVGETETGKTTLLNALAQELPDPEHLASVERAGELRLPPGANAFPVRWQVGETPGASFADQVYAALVTQPSCLLLDEVRADEPAAIAPLLNSDQPPRQIWAVRGVPDHKRLQSALGMLARRAEAGRGEELVHALYERLPFIVTVARIQQRLQLFSIAEWQSRVDTDYPDYVMLMRYADGRAQRTERTPARWLD
jgi:type IV secretory pathway ATPase VirB11/archaellum biosynthesis ATPase